MFGSTRRENEAPTQLEEGQFLWGEYALDLSSRKLHCPGVRVRLQPRLFQILHLLLEQAGKVVTRNELHRRIWSSYDYSDFDHSLNIAISKLRKTLNDSPAKPRFIETVPRLGYRFLCEVRRVGPAEIGKVRLAVLPFTCGGGNVEEEHLCEGLSGELIVQLGALNPGHLAVIARTSSMRYKNSEVGVDQIGHELDVTYALEGVVRVEGDRARVAVALIQTDDQTQVWAHSYQQHCADAFKVQRDVARRITRHLKVELLPD